MALDEWVADWEWQAVTEGEPIEWQQAWVDMANRHPCYFRGRCPTPHTHPRRSFTAGVEQWRSLVATYFRPSDVDTALRIMQCESNGNPNALGKDGDSGLFQNLARYWPERSAAAGWAGADIFDPEANVAVAAWLRQQKGGWLHWSCY